MPLAVDLPSAFAACGTATIAGFYLADSRETAWAEWYRQLAELGLRPERQLPRDLWRLSIDLDRIADLGDERRLALRASP